MRKRASLLGILCSLFASSCDGAGSTSETGSGSNDGGAPNSDVTVGPGDAANPDGVVDPGAGSEPLADPNMLSPSELFQCQGPIRSSPARIRRIGNDEWAASNGIGATDARLNPLTPNPGHQYSTFAQGETLGSVVLERFMDFAPLSVAGWTDRTDSSGSPKPKGVSCIYDEGAPEESCVRLYVQAYLDEFVLFRAASSERVDRLTAFAVSALRRAADSGQERAEAIKQINSAAWLTVGALFRSELGEIPGEKEGETRLSNEEFGKLLAYALSDHGPGAPGSSKGKRVGRPVLSDIKAAVEAGTVRERDTIAALVAAHFGGIDDERSEFSSKYWVSAKIRSFFREWLGTGALRTSFHDDPQASSGLDKFAGKPCSGDDDCESNWFCADEDRVCRPFINGSFNNLKALTYGKELALDSQLDEMIARIVVEDQDVLKNLLTSRKFFVPANSLGGLKFTSAPQFVYGVTDTIPSTREGRWWEAPEGVRAGILTHPAWLASHGDNFENGPSAVRRGLWLRENLLCGSVPEVPITVDANFSQATKELSGRARLAEATSAPECQNCHALMNPLGLPFEIYNHTGFLRANDHGGAPDGSSQLVSTGDPALDVSVADAVTMSRAFAESSVVEECFIRQVFRYFAGRNEVAADACALVAMQNAYQSSGGSLREMLVELLSGSAVLTRHSELMENQ